MNPSWIKPIRTGLQALGAFLISFCAIVPTLGLDDTGAGASVVAVAAVLSRLMTIPLVEDLLDKLGLATPGHNE